MPIVPWGQTALRSAQANRLSVRVSARTGDGHYRASVASRWCGYTASRRPCPCYAAILRDAKLHSESTANHPKSPSVSIRAKRPGVSKRDTSTVDRQPTSVVYWRVVKLNLVRQVTRRTHNELGHHHQPVASHHGGHQPVQFGRRFCARSTH